jgi:hypothetical protein
MSLAVTITPKSINLCIGGRMRTLDKSHANFSAVLHSVKVYQTEKDPDLREALIRDIMDLVDVPTFIARVTEGKVQISEDAVFYDGKKTHDVIAQRLLSMLAEGFDVTPLARFMDKMMLNPYENTRQDLYQWLEVGKLPLCEDGDFLAFKKVRDDYRSYYDGATDNAIGSKPTMDPKSCDASRYNTCSSGLHFCSFDYLSQYHGDQGRVVVVKINPANVVAIPEDYGTTKGRAWTYEVIDEVPEAECAHVFTKSVVNAMGTYTGTVYADDQEADEAEVEALGALSDALAKAPAADVVTFTTAEIEAAGDVPSEAELEQLKIVVDRNRTRDSQQIALVDAFLWDGSKQGFAYWNFVNDNILRTGVDHEPHRIIEYWIAKLEGKTIKDIGNPATDWQWTGPGHDEVLAAKQELGDQPDPGQAPIIIGIDPAAPEVEKPKFFERDGKKFTAAKVEKIVEKHGQRGAQRKLGVPRTTLQGWLKRLGLT